jgi:hypothetical protein
LAVFHASPRRDSRLLIICVISRKRTARMIGDHHDRDADTVTVLLTATDPCRQAEYLIGTGGAGAAGAQHAAVAVPGPVST